MTGTITIVVGILGGLVGMGGLLYGSRWKKIVIETRDVLQAYNAAVDERSQGGTLVTPEEWVIIFRETMEAVKATLRIVSK